MGVFLPNLFIVGEPRSGTTSLFYYLKQHPQIYMSSIKEPHYFCKDFHQEHDTLHKKKFAFLIRDEEKYLELFKEVKNEQIVGEASTTYLWSKVAAKEIYKFNPNSKIIAIFREPVSYLYSVYTFHHSLKIEDIPNFKDALEVEEERRKGIRIPKFAPTLTDLMYSYHVKYYEHLKRYYKIFPEEQIKVIIFDDLKNSPEKVYREILKFLNIELSFKPDFRVYNPSFDIRFKFLSNIYISLTHKGWQGKILPYSLKNAINKIVKKQKVKKPIDSQLKLELMKRFKPEVERFSEFIERDLVKEWGYDKI